MRRASDAEYEYLLGSGRHPDFAVRIVAESRTNRSGARVTLYAIDQPCGRTTWEVLRYSRRTREPRDQVGSDNYEGARELFSQLVYKSLLSAKQ